MVNYIKNMPVNKQLPFRCPPRLPCPPRLLHQLKTVLRVVRKINHWVSLMLVSKTTERFKVTFTESGKRRLYVTSFYCCYFDYTKPTWLINYFQSFTSISLSGVQTLKTSKEHEIKQLSITVYLEAEVTWTTIHANKRKLSCKVSHWKETGKLGTWHY